MHKDIESALTEILKEEVAANKTCTEEDLLSQEDTKKIVSFIAESMRIIFTR